MKHLFTGIAIATLSLTTSAFAHGDEDHAHDDAERVVHYEAETPKDEAAAISLLDGKADAIGTILQKEKLDGNDMEKIHEYTYSLEAAVNALREHTNTDKQESAVDVVDETVQALHYASENHDEPTAREWFTKLKPAVAEIDTQFAAKAE